MQQTKIDFTENGGNIVVATPGRLKHVFDSVQAFDVRELEVLVFDEADRLLDMGFQLTISQILAKLPKQRRTGTIPFHNLMAFILCSTFSTQTVH